MQSNRINGQMFPDAISNSGSVVINEGRSMIVDRNETPQFSSLGNRSRSTRSSSSKICQRERI